jgi:predicted Zn-dependent protease
MSMEAARATLQAELSLHDGDVAGAVAAWRVAVRADDTSPYLQVRLGECLLLVGDPMGAATAASAAWSLGHDGNDDDVEVEDGLAALRVQAQAWSELGEADRSEATLRQVLMRAPGEARASAMLAERMVARAALDDAEAVVERWMQDAPGVEGRVGLARVFAERRQIERAFRHLDLALLKAPDDEDALVLRRDLWWALGRFDEATVAARALLAARGDSPQTRSSLVSALALSDPQAAVDVANGIVADDPGERSRLVVADALERGGLIDEAIGILSSSSSRGPLGAMLTLEVARLQLVRHRPGVAQPMACGLADSLPPTDLRLLDAASSLCARAEADLDDTVPAVARLLRITSLTPPRARPLLALASVLAETTAASAVAVSAQTARAALDALDMSNLGSAETAPSVDVILAAASVLQAAGHSDEAKALAKALMRARPADRSAVLGYARLLASDADSDVDTTAAVELVEHLVERSGADVDALNFMAFALAERSLRPDDARAFAWRAVLRDPHSGYVTDTLGWAELKAGDPAAAVITLRRADRLAPDEGEIWFHIAAAEQAAGHAALSRDAADKAMRLLRPHDPLRARIRALVAELPAK